MSITVKIDEDRALGMLEDRVEYWTDDDDIQTLFSKMYENYVYGGYFDDSEFDVMAIVDNDYVNWCTVLYEGDDEYDEIKRIYKEQGIGDCSCENDCYSYIEAEHNGMFLVRS